jgi:hypothetical protein
MQSRVTVCKHPLSLCICIQNTYGEHFPNTHSHTNILPKTLSYELSKWWTPLKTNCVQHSIEFGFIGPLITQLHQKHPKKQRSAPSVVLLQ